MYQRIMKRAKELEADAAGFLSKLVRTPSFSGKEKDVVSLIQQKMTDLHFDDVRIDPLGNVIGRIGNGPRVIAFDAHVDTVYPGDTNQWTFDPFDGSIVDGYVRGRGSVDQKGGMASMVYAAQIIKELNLNRDFTILFTGTVMEEDCDGLCWQYLVQEENIRPEVVVVTEPTNLNIYRGQRGRMEIEVRMNGVSCHGSAPERGDNAIYKISRIALEIEKLHDALKTDEFLGKGSVAVTQVFSNSPSQCAVPDAAWIRLDRRLTHGETKETALAEIREAALRAGYSDVDIRLLQYNEPAYTGLRYTTEKYYPTWVLEEPSPYLQQAVSAYHNVFNRQPLVDKWTFSTNGVSISGMFGIPVVGMGPGNEIYAHAVNEAAPVDHLSKAAAFYAGFVRSLQENQRS
ncbi:MAG: YgeY family selenium metabolism-linked hydrolase [Caldithrix sp.]|nr:YgeY family selenium metabolism-linked hydrolase [Caldithrix sp.]